MSFQDQTFIPQMQPWFSVEEKKSICSYMESPGFITEYKRTEEFETLIADYVGSKHAIVVNNGTISLSLIGLALGIGYGDEVIVPNYTMIATPNSMKMIGATPIFVDVEQSTLCLDLELVKQKITSKTKAIILVSANGRSPKAGIEEFVRLANERGIYLIEDAAQALGSRFPNKKHVGTMGVAGSFSFSAPKIISTGQGGAIVTDSDAVAQKIRRLKDFGRASGGNDIHDTVGYNFKFTELQACIGIEQMIKVDERVGLKKAIWEKYKQGIKNRKVRLIENNIDEVSPWFYELLILNDRDGFITKMKELGVGTRAMYPPINMQNAYNIPGNSQFLK